jgi:hypothetical protein
MQLAEFSASAVLLLQPYNQILATKWNASQCNALQQQQILEQTNCLCNPKEESKKIRENFIKKIMHGSKIQSIQSLMVQFATTITTASK